MVGILLVFVGILVGTSVIARPVTRVLGAPIARLRGVTGRLARENAMRNPRRTASTASALTIGVSLMTFFLVFNASLSASIDDVIDEQFFGDFVVDSGTFGFGGIPPAMTDELNQLEDVEGAASVRFVSAAVDGEDEFMSSVDPAIAFDLFDIDIQEGDPLALDDDGIAVYEGQAASEGWQLGDEVTVRFAETGDRTFTIEAIYGSQALAGPFVIGHDAYDANFPQSYDSQVYVQLTDGTDPEAARPAIEAITDRFGTAELQDLGEFKRSQAEQFTPILALVSVLLSLSLIIAFIGVANTISLSVLERTREIGLTRAVGAVRRQIRAAISWESAIIAVFGSILGIAIGILLAWGVSTQLRDEGIATFVVPVGVVLVVLVVMALSGMLVAWRPARRAAKLDILTAVATE
jgi:putative ABC transport system permease protein